MSKIFTPRKAFKPFEYPEAVEFKNAISHSYWLFSEWNFDADKQDFHVKLSSHERGVVKNALLAISQIEVEVKEFWGKFGDRFPKAEFKQVGATFSESEVRHADAYSHLLEVLDLNADFEQLLQNPVIEGRVEYLSKYIAGSSKKQNEEFTLTLALFSIFIENVSLFSQFAIVKSFNKHRQVLKDIDNVIQATQKEELVHALFGIYIINKVKEENPDWFTEDYYLKLYEASIKAYEAECKIVDWIFDEGDLDFVSKRSIKELIKDRFNESLISIGGKAIFTVDDAELSKLQWFKEEIMGQVQVDFFNKKSTNYTKNAKSIKASDLFDDD